MLAFSITIALLPPARKSWIGIVVTLPVLDRHGVSMSFMGFPAAQNLHGFGGKPRWSSRNLPGRRLGNQWCVLTSTCSISVLVGRLLMMEVLDFRCLQKLGRDSMVYGLSMQNFSYGFLIAKMFWSPKCTGFSWFPRAMLLICVCFTWAVFGPRFFAPLRHRRYKFKHAGAPKFDFPLHCWWCEGEHFIKSDMVQVWCFWLFFCFSPTGRLFHLVGPVCDFFDSREAWKDWTTAEFDYQVLKDSVLGLKTDDNSRCFYCPCKSLRFFSCFFFFLKFWECKRTKPFTLMSVEFRGHRSLDGLLQAGSEEGCP